MRYIQYARRSSDEHSNKQLQSIQGQEGDLDRLVYDLHLEVVERLEESRTAKEPGRPVFNLMLDKIKKGEADAILCWHIDRLTRNELDSGTIRWLLRKGVIKEIRTPHKVYLPDDSAFITAIESAQSEQFIIDHTLRVNRGMKQKCASGGIPFRTPPGYLNNRLTRKAEVDPERFPLICQVFQTVLRQTHNVAEVHRLLHEQWGYRKRAFKNHTSHVLSLNALHNLLSNPFYAGYFTWQGETYLHDLPRAVTKDEFERVQEILKRRSHKTLKKRSFAYAGMLVCATCGYKVTAEVSKGHTYYHCNNRLKTCTKKGVREAEVERQIDILLQSIEIEPEFEALALEVLDELRQQEMGTKQSVFESKLQALAEIKRQKDALLGLFLQGHLDEGEYGAKKRELSEQEAGFKLQEGQSDEEWERSFKTVENVAWFVTHGRSLFMSGEPAAKRYVAKHLGIEYLLNNGELHVEMNPLFVPVRQEFKPLWAETKKIEPLKNGSGSRPEGQFVVRKSIWQATLLKCRKTMLENNWALSKFKSVVEAPAMRRAA